MHVVLVVVRGRQISAQVSHILSVPLSYGSIRDFWRPTQTYIALGIILYAYSGTITGKCKDYNSINYSIAKQYSGHEVVWVCPGSDVTMGQGA